MASCGRLAIGLPSRRQKPAQVGYHPTARCHLARQSACRQAKLSPNTFRQTTGPIARSSWAKTVNNSASEDDLRIRFEQHGKESKAELAGRITIDSSPEFRASLLRQLRVPDCKRLEVNFFEVVYIDTS